MASREELYTGLSGLFTAYYRLRATRKYHPDRLKRALWLAQRRTTTILQPGKMRAQSSRDKTKTYEVSVIPWVEKPELTGKCQCYDFQSHMKPGPNGELPGKPWNCFHRIGLLLIEEARRMEF